MYDQLGCGRSTHLPEKKGDHDFWTPELFLLELDNLLAHLGIQNDYDILGQSWGGQLAAEHAVRQPKGLKIWLLRIRLRAVSILSLSLTSNTASLLIWDEFALASSEANRLSDFVRGSDSIAPQ